MAEKISFQDEIEKNKIKSFLLINSGQAPTATHHVCERSLRSRLSLPPGQAVAPRARAVRRPPLPPSAPPAIL